MVAYAEDAVDYARDAFGFELDFTPGSIEYVELMADQLYVPRPMRLLRILRIGPSGEDKARMCKMLGGYVGEVYRRVKGGDWAINPELGVLGVQKGDSWVFPPTKVHKRLTNGAEDNLLSYFHVVSAPSFPDGLA